MLLNKGTLNDVAIHYVLDAKISDNLTMDTETMLKYNLLVVNLGADAGIDYRDYASDRGCIGIKRLNLSEILREYGTVFSVVKLNGEILSNKQVNVLQRLMFKIEELNKLILKNNRGIYSDRVNSHISRTMRFNDRLDIEDSKLKNGEYSTYSNIEHLRKENPSMVEWVENSKMPALLKIMSDREFKLVYMDAKDMLGTEIANVEELEDILKIIEDEVCEMYAIIAIAKTHENIEDYLDELDINGEKYVILKDGLDYKEVLKEYINTFKIFKELGEN